MPSEQALESDRRAAASHRAAMEAATQEQTDAINRLIELMEPTERKQEVYDLILHEHRSNPDDLALSLLYELASVVLPHE